MPKFYGRGHGRFSPRHRALSGAIWLIGIGVLMIYGHWWPGILVLAGISMVAESIFRESYPEVKTDQALPPSPRPAVNIPPVTPPQAESIRATHIYRTDLLPATCPQCGGPVRNNDVRWTSSQSADCPYCGSRLPMNKE